MPPPVPTPQQPQPYGVPPVQPGAPHPIGVNAPLAARPQRPGVITFAATMTVTASMLWVCGLAFVWLVAFAAMDQFDTAVQSEAVFYHMANRFHLTLLNGLAWPLFLFPLAATVAGFIVLTRAIWARVTFTVLGVASLIFLVIWLRSDAMWLLPAGAYIAFCVAMVWTPAAGRWYSAPR